MPKFKLDFDETEVDPIKVYGLISDLQILSLCFRLNKDLNLSLARCEQDLKVQEAEGIYHYAVYQHLIGEAPIYLCPNRSYLADIKPLETGSLFHEEINQEKGLIKTKDPIGFYLWHFENEDDSQLYRNIVSEIKTLSYIKALSELKPRQTLMFEEKTKDYHGI